MYVQEKKTAEFFDHILTRLGLVGAVYLGILTVLQILRLRWLLCLLFKWYSIIDCSWCRIRYVSSNRVPFNRT